MSAGRRRSTTQDQIAGVAIELFAARGFDEVSVDDVAAATGISRRTLFRYYPSKNAIPWGNFDGHLQRLRELLATLSPRVTLGHALREALLAFNTYDDSEMPEHRQRMRVILETAGLQAYSMTMYAGWRAVIADYVAVRTGRQSSDLIPQTVAWLMLGVALSAYEHWLADESVSLTDSIAEAFDIVSPGLDALAG
jgi:mycofactocin system transcriptional regulator